MWRYMEVVKGSSDKKYFRLKIVQVAKGKGIKAAARAFGCSRNTVKKWLKRYKEGGYQELEDISRRPINCYGQTPAELEQKVVGLKKQNPTFGAERLSEIYEIKLSPRTMRAIWRRAGIGYRPRKKHKTRHNLREIKRRWKAFSHNQVDVKDLIDIPEYWLAIMDKKLPRYQYTWREPSCGFHFLAYGYEHTLNNSVTFLYVVAQHLLAMGFTVEELKAFEIQTDNGSEFIGSWQAKDESEFLKRCNQWFGGYNRIKPGAKNCQGDVESVHGRIEPEFYIPEGKGLQGIEDLLWKARIYLAYFNAIRTNSYKEHKSPWQLLREQKIYKDKNLCIFPVVVLEDYAEKYLWPILKGGQDLPAVLELRE